MLPGARQGVIGIGSIPRMGMSGITILGGVLHTTIYRLTSRYPSVFSVVRREPRGKQTPVVGPKQSQVKQGRVKDKKMVQNPTFSFWAKANQKPNSVRSVGIEFLFYCSGCRTVVDCSLGASG